MASPSGISSRWLSEQIADATARGIASDVGALIRSGALPAGEKLPTVRALAEALHVSPGTVAEAWAALRRSRAIASHGRRGTVVIGPPSPPRPARFERAGQFGSRLQIDLSLATPDHRLLPSLDAALSAAQRGSSLNEYARVLVTPELEAAAAPTWPFTAERLLAVSGGFEGLQHLSAAAVRPGDRVAVENPTTPRLLDILDLVGAEVVPVDCDSEGPRPDSLSRALRSTCVAFVFQPRAQSPCGHALTPTRASDLATVLRPTSTLVVENDGMSELSTQRSISVGEHLPGRTALVRSYSKSHGPDLRIAVIGGPAELVEQSHRLQMFGAGWVSRLLQNALAYLLGDPDVTATVARAAQVYADRRHSLLSALRERGVDVGNRDGLSLWIPVHDEQEALVTLAANGIAAGPGSRFWVQPTGRDHIRVSASRLDDDYDEMADILSTAATSGA